MEVPIGTDPGSTDGPDPKGDAAGKRIKSKSGRVASAAEFSIDAASVEAISDQTGPHRIRAPASARVA